MYKALVIGCGNIGAGYDLDTDQVLTHVKAFSKNEKFLLSIFDTNKLLAKKISEKYNCNVVEEINNSTLTNFDCVSICSPTQTHFEYLTKTIDAKVKVIICEKPVSNNFLELQNLRNTFQKNSSRVIVNYFRRFQPSFIQLRKKIESIAQNEKLSNISIRYQRGFINNCSHAFDTIGFLMSKEIELTEIKKHNQINDHFENDSTLSIQAKWDETNVDILGLSNVLFSHFEIDLYFEFHKIIIKEAGQTIEIYKAEKSPAFLKPLVNQTTYTDCLKNYMCPVIENAETLLNNHLLEDNFMQSVNLNQRMLNYLNN